MKGGRGEGGREGGRGRKGGREEKSLPPLPSSFHLPSLPPSLPPCYCSESHIPVSMYNWITRSKSNLSWKTLQHFNPTWQSSPFSCPRSALSVYPCWFMFMFSYLLYALVLRDPFVVNMLSPLLFFLLSLPLPLSLPHPPHPIHRVQSQRVLASP